MPTFVPTEEEKRFVLAMAGTKMTREEICSVILNPRTNKPIDVMTLDKAFAAELAAGRSQIKKITSVRFYDAVDRGEPWALKMALRNFHGITDESTVGVGIEATADAESMGIRVVFVKPNHRSDG